MGKKRSHDLTVARMEAPKARSAYALFLSEKYPEISSPGRQRETLSQIGKMWRELPEDQKNVFEERSKAEFQRKQEHVDRTLDTLVTPLASLPASSETTFGPYQLFKSEVFGDCPISSGSFGQVMVVRDKGFLSFALVKVFKEEREFHAETKVYKAMQEHFGTGMWHGVMRLILSSSYPSVAPWIVLQFMPCTLKAHLANHGSLGAEELAAFFSQLKYGLQALHSKGFVHGDIKPSCVMIDIHRREARLGDFAMSLKMKEVDPSDTFYTGPYRAPELWGHFSLPGGVGVATETWAFACCLVEAASGKVLFASFSALSDFVKAGGCLRKLRDFELTVGKLSVRMQKLVLSMLEVAQASRKCIQDVDHMLLHG